MSGRLRPSLCATFVNENLANRRLAVHNSSLQHVSNLLNDTKQTGNVFSTHTFYILKHHSCLIGDFFFFKERVIQKEPDFFSFFNVCEILHME